MDRMLAESAEDLFTASCPPQAVRAMLRGEPGAEAWAAIEASGFADALVPGADGGSGLTVADIVPLLLASGRHAVPLPLAATCLVRAAFARAGQTAPAGPIAIGQALADGSVRVASQHLAGHVLVPTGSGALLLPTAAATIVPTGPAEARLRWEATGNATRLDDGTDWLLAGALLEAMEMAGAMERILADTTAYATGRKQFGKPIAGFQAIQQQMAVLAEEVAACVIAAQLGASDASDPARVACAKIRVGEGAIRVAAIAHGVFGAMGITEEVDLYLATTRLQRGRGAFGAEAWWAERLGGLALAAGSGSLEFVRERLGPVLAGAREE
jgi:acyl-CoA dehydrogenase